MATIIAKNSKQRLFEVMEIVDKTFKKPLNENSIINEAKEDLIEYDIPSWALSALINGDYSGLNDEDEAKLNEFTKNVAVEFGNAHFIMDDVEGEDDLGFRWGNDIDNMGGDVVRLYINPSNIASTEQNVEEAKQFPINRKYTHFAILKSNKKILNGWDYTGYDAEDLKIDKKVYFFQDIIDMDINPKLVEIQTKKNLEKKGINPFDGNNWYKFEAEGWRDRPDELHENTSNEFIKITAPLNSSTEKMFVDVVNKGIDSYLEGFTKSKFTTEKNSLGVGRVFNFHKSEMPILLRRLEEIGTEEALDWKDNIENYNPND